MSVSVSVSMSARAQCITFTTEDVEKGMVSFYVIFSSEGERTMTIHLQDDDYIKTATTGTTVDFGLENTLDYLCKNAFVTPHYRLFSELKKYQCTFDPEKNAVSVTVKDGATVPLGFTFFRSKVCRECIVYPEIDFDVPTARHDFFWKLTPEQLSSMDGLFSMNESCAYAASKSK